MLILKRNPDAEYSESYNVLFEGRHVGRIYYANRPLDTPWFWGLDFFEWQDSDGPQYGHVASLEAAKQAFRAAWDRSRRREEKASRSARCVGVRFN